MAIKNTPQYRKEPLIEQNEKDESFAINKMIMQTENLPHPNDMDTSFAASVADSRYVE